MNLEWCFSIPKLHFSLLRKPKRISTSNFLESNTRPGTGGVGKQVLAQLRRVLPVHPSARVVMICNSHRSVYNPPGSEATLSLDEWEEKLSASDQNVNATHEFLKAMVKNKKMIVIDNTSREDAAALYTRWLSAGISVVTPNKKAFSGDLASYRDLVSSIRSAQNPSRGLLYHESSVGAGLPIISTLKDLMATGDEVYKIEGVFSGTMSFLFNNFAPADGSKGGSWSEEVIKAKNAGYTEPDPRDDLNGMDVARKLVILARLAGYELEGIDAFPVQSLIPKELESAASGDTFLAEFSKYDDRIEAIRDEATAEGKVIRYVGSVDLSKKEANVGIEKLDKDHPIAGLKGSDNMISFHTKRYGGRPLVVQGAG